MAKNDWIVAGINNPTFTNADFSDVAGLTVDNTQFLSKEEYLKSDFIKNNPLFQDNNGNFSKEKFSNYYDARARDFGEFQDEDFTRGPALDMFDIMRTPDSPIKDIHFDIRRGVNPDRQAIGIEGVNVWSDPKFSQREIAKQNKVFDTASGKYKDYTVNDHTLTTNPVEWFKDVFTRDSLVLATWDEDGKYIDPISGLEKEHKKGDAKLNDKGTYYYETLNGRSVMGKDVLSVFDTFTVDGQGLNKYDFFDSNDIKKSATGVVAKNIAALLPMFIPGAGNIYAAAFITKEMMKSLPMLYGFMTALSDSDTPGWMNTLATIGEKFTGSTSDYAKQKTFAFENFGNLISDVALQWGQQKFIATRFNDLRKTATTAIKKAQEKATARYLAELPKFTGREEELMQVCNRMYVEPAMKLAAQSGQLGRDMSLAYMAIISNTDVYEDMLEHGASKTEAAAVALGSTIGMFSVDKYLHLGEVFFDEATPDATKQARRAIRNEFKQAQQAFDNIKASDTPVKNKILRYIKKASDLGKKTISQFNEDLRYHSLGMFGKMVGEGLEEVSEELVTDLSKSMYELAGELGFDTSTKDVGAWDNAFERYVMNFLGGAIGGGIFYGKEVWDGKTFHRPKNDEDLATLIRNGHVDELREQLATLTREGKSGSKKLSAYDYERTDDGKVTWRTTENPANSQGQVISNIINDKINIIEEVLLANRFNLTDDELFENMVLSEDRYRRYKNISETTNYYQDFATLLNSEIQAEQDLLTATKTIEGTPSGTPISNDATLRSLNDDQIRQREENIAKQRDEVEKAREKVRAFLDGETSLDYTRKLNFILDPMLHAPFLSVNKDEYSREKHDGKAYDQLTPEEQLKFEMEEWPDYIQTQLKTRATEAWKKYKDFESKINPHLDQIGQDAKAYRDWQNGLRTLLSQDFMDDVVPKYKEYKDKLENESDEEYANRDKKIINPLTGQLETDDEYNRRRNRRMLTVIAYNDEQDKIRADKIRTELEKVGMVVDPQLASTIKQVLSARGGTRSIINRKIAEAGLGSNLRNLLKTLKPDLSNVDEITQEARESISKNIKRGVQDLYSSISNITLEDSEGTMKTLKDYLIQVLDVEVTGALSIKNLRDHFSELIDEIRAKGENGEKNTEEKVEGETVEGESEEESTEVSPFGEEVEFEPTIESLNKAIEVLDTAMSSGIKGIEDIDSLTIAGEELTAEQLFDSEINRITDERFANQKNAIDSVVRSIANNPLIKLQAFLKKDIKNPIGELIKKVAAANGDVVPNIEEILSNIEEDFDNVDDIGQLILNDAQRESVEKAKAYLKMLVPYVYAASTVPNTKDPIGHNRTINAYAQSHADKLRNPWDELPEIDSDLAHLYLTSINEYIDQIDYWISLSDNNSINKINKVISTDGSLNSTLWKVLAKIPRTFNFEGRTYDLLNGIDQIDTSQLETKMAQVPLYKLERLLFNNIRKIAIDNSMSVLDFIKISGILNILVPGYKEITNQRSSGITDSLTPDTFTTYDRLQYVLTVITDDPAHFFGRLKQSVAGNAEIAPITVQEYSSRIAQAELIPTFRECIRYARSNMIKIEEDLLPNTVIVSGVAGAGKTQVILGSVDAMLKDKTVMIAGPTEEQASALQKALNRNFSLTFTQLLENILGAEQYKKIRSVIEGADSKDKDYETEFYKVTEGKDELPKVRIKKDAITFNQVVDPPVAIYLDEATHLSTVEAQIIAAYAESVGAAVYMLGDFAQNGYINSKASIFNIDEAAVFAVRTPKLTISLRDNNLQKYQNLNNVRSIVENVLEKRLYESDAKYNEYYSAAKNLISALNFRVYQGEELNGDLITSEIDEGVINHLKKAASEGKSIAFIGNSSSAHLAKVRDAGIDIDSKHVLSIDTMQGQEYDIVIIDQDYKVPENMGELRPFIQKLYTLMSRPREVAIFIDNGLSQIIGANTVMSQKSKAPSIGQAIDQLRQQKLEVLSQIDTSDAVTLDAKAQESTDNPPAQLNPEEDFHDPDERSDNAKEIEAVKEINAAESEDVDTNLTVDISGEGDPDGFPIECYGDCTYLNVDVEDTGTTLTSSNGITYPVVRWSVTVPTGEGVVLRNLQAIKPSGVEPTEHYTDKIELQKSLYKVKSAILFNHSWPTQIDTTSMPNEITDNFNKDDWERGTYELEFRRPSKGDVIPLHSPFKEIGLTYEGEQFIANIVFSVKNKKGQVCKFDLAGLNNPKTLIDNKGEIKKGLQAKIANPRTNDTNRARLQKMLNSIDSGADAYRTWFDDKFNKFKELIKNDPNAILTINVSNAVTPTGTTWFRKRPGEAIRLSTSMNLNAYTWRNRSTIKDPINLIQQNPDKKFSPIYTFSALNEGDLKYLDSSIKGKAIIFVTSDILMKEGDLIKEYIAQKKYPETHTPKVRMIILDNYGLSYSQLSDPQFMENFSVETIEKEGENPVVVRKAVYRHNFVGIRMFVSMWNARVALIKFNEALAQWKHDHTLSDDQVLAITKAHYQQYEGEGNPEETLKSAGLAVDDTKLLDEFNNERCLDIPMFRLGYSTNVAGIHIQRFNITGSAAYKEDQKEANLCVINPQRAVQFEEILDRLVQFICPDGKVGILSAGCSLNASLIKRIPDPDNPGKTKEVRWAKDEFIDPEDAKHRRSLSGMLTDDGNKVLTIQTAQKEGDQDEPSLVSIDYAKGSAWSAVPRLLATCTRTLKHFQGQSIANTDRDRTYVKYTYAEPGRKGDKETWKTLIIPVTDFFTGDQPLLPSGTKTDHTLDWLMDIIFHGTIENIHRKYSAERPLMQMDDAYFKKGFFINPEISRKKEDAQGRSIPGFKTGEGSEMSFFEIETSPALFTADVDVCAAGMRLSLDRLIHPEKYGTTPKVKSGNVNTGETLSTTEGGETPEESEDFETEFRSKHSEIADIIDKGDEDGYPYDFTVSSIEEAITRYNRTQENNLKALFKGQSPEKTLDMVIGYNPRTYVPFTYRQKLERSYEGATITVQDTEEGRKIVITTEDGKVYMASEGEVKGPIDIPSDSTSDSTPETNPRIKAIDNLLLVLAKEAKNENSPYRDAINSLGPKLFGIIGMEGVLSDDEIIENLQEIQNDEEYSDLFEDTNLIDGDLLDAVFLNC